MALLHLDHDAKYNGVNIATFHQLRMSKARTIWNFGKNVQILPEHVYQPASTEELLAILAKHRDQKFRAVGSLHAWSDAAKTSGVIVETKRLDSIEIDVNSQTVVVGGGCKVKHLLHALAKQNLTLPSLGLIDEQTVAGATATATHGSGRNSLSHYVMAVEIAHLDQETGEPILTWIESGVELEAVRCSIGLLGIVVVIKFRCRPAYNIEEHATAHTDLDAMLSMESDYPQQQFYLIPWSWNYFGHHRVESAKPRSSLATLYRWYCYLVIDVGLHVAMFVLAKILKSAWAIRFFFNRILPLTIVRKWRVVDDSHAMLTMEHELFRHIEIEVFVQRTNLTAATEFLIDMLCWCGGLPLRNRDATELQIEQLQGLDFEGLKDCYVHHYPICYRRIECDEALISMAAPSRESNEDWYAISLISYQRPTDRQGFFKFADFIGPAMAKLFGARCHWGKYNPLDKAANEQLYPRLAEFQRTAKQYDGNSSFVNEWLDHVI